MASKSSICLRIRSCSATSLAVSSLRFRCLGFLLVFFFPFTFCDSGLVLGGGRRPRGPFIGCEAFVGDATMVALDSSSCWIWLVAVWYSVWYGIYCVPRPNHHHDEMKQIQKLTLCTTAKAPHVDQHPWMCLAP